jgi:formylmethanofuran dehydrogenase subunit E
MLPFILGIGAGILIDNLVISKKGTKSNDDRFFVYVRSEDFGKNTLTFNGYKSAKIVFDRIAKKKKVQYRDIVDFDSSEKKLYERWKEEGNIGTDGYPKGLMQYSKVESLSIGFDNEDFETKEF